MSFPFPFDQRKISRSQPRLHLCVFLQGHVTSHLSANGSPCMSPSVLVCPRPRPRLRLCFCVLQVEALEGTLGELQGKLAGDIAAKTGLQLQLADLQHRHQNLQHELVRRALTHFY